MVQRTRSLRTSLTNLRAPVPWPRKGLLLLRNLGLRLVRLQTCCGHPGQPGC